MLEGHPTPRHPVGRRRDRIARTGPADRRSAWRSPAKRLDRLPYARLGALRRQRDGRGLACGRRYEHAAHYELDNLTAIIDVNRLGQRGETMLGWDLDAYVAPGARRSAGTRSRSTATTSRRSTDAYAEADRRPRAADGRDRREDDEGQGRRGGRGPERLARQAARRPDAAIAELGGDARHPRRGREARRSARRTRSQTGHRSSCRATSSATEVATRKAYGDALAALGAARADVVALDGEVSNSTFAEDLPRRRIPSATSRCTSPSSSWSRRRSACRRVGWRPVRIDLRARSSRARTTSSAWRRSVAREPTALAARTPASRSARTGRRRWRSRTSPSLRAVHGSTVLHPCDANQTAKLVAAHGRDRAASRTCARCGRATPVLYSPGRGVRDRRQPRRCARATTTRSRSSRAGITVHEALKAADTLAEEGIAARVIDLYSIKPLDAQTLRPRRPRRQAAGS